jgi:hypothetical protein
VSEPVRPVASYRDRVPAEDARRAEALRVRSLACWAHLRLLPAFLFLRQRSEFVQGWEAAAAAGAALGAGPSAGAVGTAGAPALGSWMMLPDLTDERTRTVLPMNDALYGAAQVELDRMGPVVVGVPRALPDGRYWSVAILDAELANVGHLGPRWTGEGPGEHLLVGPAWDGEAPDWAAGLVRSPTDSVLLLHRVLVGYEPGDLDVARRWREGFTLTPLAERGGGARAPVDTAGLVHEDLRRLTDPRRFFALSLEHLRHNPPPREDAALLELLGGAGLEGAADEAHVAALAAGVADAQLIVDGAISARPRREGWTVPFPHTGERAASVLERAVTQVTAIGANDAREALYLFADRDADGRALDASAGAVYELRFEAAALPPLDAPGFWSVTMYKASDGLLVANPLGRHSTRTSRPGFALGPDGSATIVLAAERPEGVSEANWLPAPADEPFQLGLRIYYPRADAREGRWAPPAVTRA